MASTEDVERELEKLIARLRSSEEAAHDLGRSLGIEASFSDLLHLRRLV